MTLEKTLPVAPVQPFVPLPSLPLDQIILGDNCEVMRTMPSESIDLVVTSPPYDDLRTYGGHAWDFYGVAWNLKRLLKPGGVIVWVVSDATKDGSETLSSMYQAQHFKDIGLKVYDTMIWDKGVPTTPTESRYYATWEYVFVISKGKPKTLNLLEDRENVSAGSKRVSLKNCRKEKRDRGGKEFVTAETGRRFNVWTVNPSCLPNGHPAVFPEKLARDHIVSWSNEGDIVLDPFSGSGTTAKMAKHNGRRFIGIEVNPEYVEIAEKRLAQNVLF
jgi:site-specific DNA-methyltransferase (adenine-specific)